MGSNENCRKCGSSKIVPRARVADNSESGDFRNVRLAVARKPRALIRKKEKKADIWARVCGECGYVELFVDTPQEVYDAYIESLQQA